VVKFAKFFLVFLILGAALSGGFYLRYFKEEFAKSEKRIEASASLLSVISQKILSALNAKAKEESQTLLFVGDVMLSRGIDYMVRKHGNGDFSYPFLKIADFLRDADLLFGNLEGPISERGKNQGSIYSFRAKPQAVQGLKFAGFDILSVVNNHILDWGRVALIDTLDILKTNGIASAGAGRNYAEANEPAIINFEDTRIAFFAYTNLVSKSFSATKDSAGISFFDLERVKKSIAETRAETDIIIVSLHWGEEYKTKASDFQKKLAHELIDAGADLIIGHHPHVAQEVEQYRGKRIAYSLGNFVFDQNFSEDTRRGLMLKVTVQDKKISTVQPISIKFSPTFQPELAEL